MTLNDENGGDAVNVTAVPSITTPEAASATKSTPVVRQKGSAVERPADGTSVDDTDSHFQILTALRERWMRDHDRTPLTAWRDHLDELTDRWRDIIIDVNASGYESGALESFDQVVDLVAAPLIEHGRSIERRAQEDRRRAGHDAYLDAEHKALAASLAGARAFADLCELRGQHDRAAKQRRMLRERGVA